MYLAFGGIYRCLAGREGGFRGKLVLAFVLEGFAVSLPGSSGLVRESGEFPLKDVL